jgi:hypothetical protein
MNQKLTAERLRQILNYDPGTGVFTWLAPTSRAIRAGSVAGTKGAGYVGIMIDGYRHYAHRLAWLYSSGSLPKGQIDHINGDRRDNRLSNLRECSGSENQQNRPPNRSNKCGLIGVCWHKSSGQWQSQIGVNGKTRSLGMYRTPEAAHQAYLEAKSNLHQFQPMPRKETA